MSATDLQTASRLDLDDDRDESRFRRLEEEASKLKIPASELDVFLRNHVGVEQIPKHPAMRRAMLQYLKKNETPPPKWMVVSGFFDESHLDATERRRRIRIIYNSAVLIIRRELKRHEVDEFRSERSVFWDPVSEVCQSMEICQSKLSRFCKELTGNSLAQVIDGVRAEGLKGKLRAGVKEFLVSGGKEVSGFQGSKVSGFQGSKVSGFQGSKVSGFQGSKVSGFQGSKVSGSRHGATLGTEMGRIGQMGPMGQMGEEIVRDKWAVWEALRASRKWPEFSQNTWAQEMGFSSYRRLYRACQVAYRMTPHQLEMALIEECLGGEVSGFQGSKVSGFQAGKGTGPEFVEVTLEEAERMVREIRPDEWMVGTREEREVELQE